MYFLHVQSLTNMVQAEQRPLLAGLGDPLTLAIVIEKIEMRVVLNDVTPTSS